MQNTEGLAGLLQEIAACTRWGELHNLARLPRSSHFCAAIMLRSSPGEFIWLMAV
jgi:hypothetical protein